MENALPEQAFRMQNRPVPGFHSPLTPSRAYMSFPSGFVAFFTMNVYKPHKGLFCENSTFRCGRTHP